MRLYYACISIWYNHNNCSYFVAMKSKLVILLFAIVATIVVFNEDRPSHNQFSCDVCGYYLYLPAVFIYKDVSKLAFYPTLDKEYNNSMGLAPSLYDFNGKKLNKYSVGVAFFELPLFLVAHAYSSIKQQYKADGFTYPYQLAGIFSNILWIVFGLFVLRRLLLNYFSENVTTLTLTCVAFGTNLYAYTAFIYGMSHAYSFFLFSGLLYLSDSIYRKGNGRSLFRIPVKQGLLIGLIMGFIFIVRPVNIIAALIPIAWYVYDLPSLQQRVKLLLYNYKNILFALITFLVVAAVQFVYWKSITGHWLFDSYIHEGFDFLHPHIIKGFFSYKKGWLLYTPMAGVALIGFYQLWKKQKSIAVTSALLTVIMTYVIFSWREWWYGGGFSARALVELLPVLSLPLAAIIAYSLSLKRLYKKAALLTVIAFLIFFNLFQTYQYSMGLIHWTNMTKKSYWYVFGKVDADHKVLDGNLSDKQD